MSLGASTTGWTSGQRWQHVLDLVRATQPDRPDLLTSLGRIVLTAEGWTALHLRSAYRALLGQPGGFEGTVGKTVVADFAQQVGDFIFSFTTALTNVRYVP